MPTRIEDSHRMSSEDSISPTQVHESHPQIRLACIACQRKKIKCDRNFPCGQCSRSSLHCVPSQRKPRVRHAGKRTADSELRTRISKLESLVETLSGDSDAPTKGQAQGTTEDIEQAAKSRNMGKYMGGLFWMNLTREVQSLRDELEEEDADDDDHQPVACPQMVGSTAHEYDVLVCPPSSIFVMPGALEEPSASVAHQLYELYFQNVDPVFKIFHAPTLKSFLLQNTPYLGQDPSSPPNRALRASIWFSAITTLTEDDCSIRFGQTRTDLLSRYRRHVDVLFAQADLMNTTDLATLQGYTLYNMSARLHDSSRRTWTMMAVIVQIARAMGLHTEHLVDSVSPFQKELRRRLWHQIRVMDCYFAADRGSVTLVASDSWCTPLPRNVNDSEFDEASEFIPDHDKGITDITFNRMAQVATTLTIRHLSPDLSNKQETWQQRLDAALNVGREIRDMYLQYCDLNQPFHRFLHNIGNAMTAANILRAVRPIQRHLSSVPPRADSPMVLQMAVNCLRESEAVYQDVAAQKWLWVFWVQWHGLAVTLAGLCAIRDTELANTAWMYVEQCYERHADYVADTTRGLLWRPIVKLYKKARAFRDNCSPEYSNSSSPPTAIPPVGSTPAAFTPGSVMSNKQAQLPPGAMPTSGVCNASMDLPIGDSFGDMMWQDWENLMEDIGLQDAGDQLPLGEMHAFPDLNGY